MVDVTSLYGYILGDVYLGAVDSLQAEPNNEKTACWQAGNITRYEIYRLANEFNPSLIANRFQVFQIKVQNTIEACALKVLINYIDSRMSNLVYTLGVTSNIISQSLSGIQNELIYINDRNVDDGNVFTKEDLTNNGPSIAIYQSLNMMFWVSLHLPDKERKQWYLYGFYGMKLLAGLLNFKAPNVSAGLASV